MVFRARRCAPKETLEQKLGRPIDLLAWPFGIYDDWLMDAARRAGYRAGFTLDGRAAGPSDQRLAFPRYLMTDARRECLFERLLVNAIGAVAQVIRLWSSAIASFLFCEAANAQLAGRVMDGSNR